VPSVNMSSTNVTVINPDKWYLSRRTSMTTRNSGLILGVAAKQSGNLPRPLTGNHHVRL
jgi:hypothetical protein